MMPTARALSTSQQCDLFLLACSCPSTSSPAAAGCQVVQCLCCGRFRLPPTPPAPPSWTALTSFTPTGHMVPVSHKQIKKKQKTSMFPSICTNVLLADTKKSHWCFRSPMNQNNSPVMQYCALMSVLICDIQLFPFIERGPAGSLGCFLSMIYTHTNICK